MSYTAPKYVLQPGQRETIPVVGREIAVIEADKDFLIAVNSGEPHYIDAGLQLRTETPFSNIVLRNPHAEVITVRLGITDGEIKDNRASVSATLPVRDPADQSSFSDVIAKIEELNQQRLIGMPVGEFSENVHLGAEGGQYRGWEPEENVNGVVVRRLWVMGNGTPSETVQDRAFVRLSSTIPIDTNTPVIGYVPPGKELVWENFFVPPGKTIVVTQFNGKCLMTMTWDHVEVAA